MTLDPRVAALRARCEDGPVGVWSSCEGTFETVMSQRLEFRDDGTGECVLYGALGGEQERFEFTWRLRGPCAISIHVGEDEGDPEEWEEVDYDFGTVTHDAGTEAVMHLPAWSLLVLAPLRLRGG